MEATVTQATILKTYLDVTHFELVTLSPVFIGGHLYQNIQLLEEKDLIDLLKKEDLIEDWLNYFTRSKSFQNDPLTLEKFFVQNKKLQNQFYNRLNISGFATTTGSVFIPGSTIKGAFRTAILSEIIERKLNKGETFQDISRLLDLYNLSDQSTSYVSKIMRCFHVSDSDQISKNFLFSSMLKHKAILPGNQSVPLKIFNKKEKEFLKNGASFKFSITIDKVEVSLLDNEIKDIFASSEALITVVQKHYRQVLQEIEKDLESVTVVSQFSSPQERLEARNEYVRAKFPKGLLKDPNRMSEYVKKFEREFDEKYRPLSKNITLKGEEPKIYDKTLNLEPIINIGAFGGFNTKVVLKSLAGKDFKKYMEQKKANLQMRYKNHNHINKLKAPRYIKLVNNMTVGWCHIRIL